ncbi:MAG TPA: hypothetical protein VGL80_00255 [Pseudonocardiaceae bacterium]
MADRGDVTRVRVTPVCADGCPDLSMFREETGPTALGGRRG